MIAREIALPASAIGVGLKPAHFAEILGARPALNFFEIHAENYMASGGPAHRWLSALAEIHPLSLHGVGLSLGSSEKLDAGHLARLKRLERLYRPALVSEHLAWCSFAGAYFPDLLPLPYDESALRRTADKISAVQEVLGRAILIENPATYLRFQGDALAEPQFLDELAGMTGCGLLLDVANVHVAATNHGFDSRAYFDAFPLHRVAEIHLAGSAEIADADGSLLIDDHGSAVKPEVWTLYEDVLRRAGPRPTLIEWDNHVPDFSTLLAEAEKARAVQGSIRALTPNLSTRHPGVTPPKIVATEKTDEAGAERWPISQHEFAAALRDPAAPIPALFAPCDTPARFAIYRNNSAMSVREALKEQFPTVLRMIGDEAFSGLARAYGREHFPNSPVLGEYGGGFLKFLENFAEIQEQTPYLPDLARLDWAWLAALRAAEAEPAPLSALAAIDPERIAGTRAELHPSLTLIESDWPLLALRAADRVPVMEWRGGAVLALRPGADALLAPCPTGAASFVAALLRGEPLGPATEQTGQDFDFGAVLVELTRLGAFTRFLQE